MLNLKIKNNNILGTILKKVFYASTKKILAAVPCQAAPMTLAHICSCLLVQTQRHENI